MQRLKLSEFWVRLHASRPFDLLQNRWQNQPLLRLRLVEVRQGKTMYGYITSVLDPQVLPPYAVADLYGRRWRIEEAFNTAKRLLGLSYLWTGSINGVKLKFGQLVLRGFDWPSRCGSWCLLCHLTVFLWKCCFVVSIISIMHISGAGYWPGFVFCCTWNNNLDVMKTSEKPQPLNLSPFPLTNPAFP